MTVFQEAQRAQDIPDGMLWSVHLSDTEAVGALGYSRHLIDERVICHLDLQAES